MPDAETPRTFIRARRTLTGMGKHETAVSYGLAVDTLTKIRKGKRDLHRSRVLKVCHMRGISVDVCP